MNSSSSGSPGLRRLLNGKLLFVHHQQTVAPQRQHVLDGLDEDGGRALILVALDDQEAVVVELGEVAVRDTMPDTARPVGGDPVQGR
jgi:hypothetical protein